MRLFSKPKGEPDLKHLVAYKDMDEATRLHQRIEEIRPVLEWLRDHPEDGITVRLDEITPPRFIHDLIRELDRRAI